MTDNVKMEPEKMEGSSLDISEQRRHELKQLFPGVFTETIGADGQPLETIDFERLKAELGTFSDVYEGRRERYGMEWPGKRDCMKLIQEPSRATLKPCREESVDFDATQNLFIEGDNLEVLKLLQKSYYGKVKMIYIDPPYNTGKEFIYPDKYSESLETYLAYAGLVDDEGKKFSTNTAAEGRFHTKWLNMMYPRLRLARNLLKDDGVIFISIDDNESSNLRKMCDEIFGEENFVAQLVWEKKKKGAFLSGAVTNVKEYLFVFAKSKESFPGLIGEIARGEETYPVIKTTNARAERIIKKGIPSKFRDKDHYLPSGSRISSGNMEMILLSDLVIKDGVLVEDVVVDSNWIYSQELLDKYAEEKSLYITQDLYFRRVVSEPRTKMLKDLLSMRGASDTGFEFRYSDSLFDDGWGTNEDGFDEIHELFGAQSIMSFPKPSKLISKLALSASRSDKDAIIMDFFAGSCTTAHAVMKLNEGDFGRRKFIMVQLPETTDKDDEAYKAGYKTIAEIGKERIRRSAQQIREERGGQEDQEGKNQLDLGFKVLKLEQSNFKLWQQSHEEPTADQLGQQLALHADHIDPDASQEDILYELLIKAGFMPTEKIETLDLAGIQVFSIADGSLLICLEEKLSSELIDSVADLEPMQFICLDKGFKGNDQLKANAVQTFKSRSQGAETEMVFKVV